MLTGLFVKFLCLIFDKMSKVIYTGLESSGKSYKLAMVADDLLMRNARWFLESGQARPIASNMKFSDGFVERARTAGVPIVYWKDLDELVELENCDVIIDEVGNYFDARGWSELTLDVRRWLTQGAKCGVEIYGSAQDFAQIDKAFRRLVKELYYIRKIIGSPRPSPRKPPVKKIWGLCLVHELQVSAYDEDKQIKQSIFPSFFFIERKYCEIFDTNQKIVKSAPPPLRKVVRVCPEDGFKQVRYY